MRSLASADPAARSVGPRLADFGRAWSVLAAAAVVVAVVVAAGGPQAAAAPAPRPRLLVIGDSIILGTGNNIATDLPDWDVTFDAAVSRSTEAGLAALQGHGTDFQAVVLALGANDGGSPGVFQPRVAALLTALDGVPHVVWLTIHEARPYYAQTNAIIRSEVALHPNAEVGDWNAAIKPGDVGDDGLHLTPQGSTDMAAWVAGVVRSAATPTTTTTTPPTTSTTTSTSTTTTLPASTTTTVKVGQMPRGVRIDPPAGGSGAGGWWIAVAGIGLLAVATAVGLVVTARRSAAARAAATDDGDALPRS